MSSPAGQGKCEKGNVARIVDRLSKQDFGSTSARSENVPLKANRAGVGSVSAAVESGGNGLSLGENVAADGAGEGVSDVTNGQRVPKESAVVRFSYAAQQPDELDLKEGDELAVLGLEEDGWARGCILHSASNPQAKGRSGLYPTNFVSTISPTLTTQSAPVVVHSSTLSQCKTEEKQSAEPFQPIASQTPAAKTSSALSSSSSIGPVLANGAGVVQSANVLPSSLLRGVAPPNVAAGARRAMSTLITPTTAAMALEGGGEANAHKAKEFAKVLYNYEAANPDELSLSEGTVVTVVSRHCEEEDWFIAEHEGRRGLFPDNFVRFLDHGHLPTSPNSQPPSLPAKPSKLCAIANPSVNATQKAAVPLINSRNSVNALVKSAAESAKGTVAEMHQSMVVERTSQIAPKQSLTNATTDSLLKTNAALLSNNRRSVIEGLQKQLFPNGKLPPQRPPQPNLGPTRQSFGTIGDETNTEPKFQSDGEAPAKLLVSSSSIVKWRTNIAPSNKRPPSKVNSAADLADAAIGLSSFGQPNVFPTMAPQSHLHPASEEMPSAAIVGTPSGDTSPSPTASVCPIGTNNKPTVFPTRSSSPLHYVSEHHQQHNQRTLSPSPTNVVSSSSKHSRAAAHSPPADHSNFISRVEFELYKKEQEDKLTALQDELKELRNKIASNRNE